jgi:molybdopterin-guanine dinucleotide biosynthesis protein A
MAPDPSLFGLVLAGGRSTRFGADKAAALLEGRPLLRWALTHLDGACARVAVSTRTGGTAEALAAAEGRTILYDGEGHASGPLSGVAAGLAWANDAGAAALAVEPVDAPRLPPDLHRTLAAAMGAAPAAYAETDAGPHPLCAVWRVEALLRLEAALADGRHPSVWRFLDSLGAVKVRFSETDAFLNANRPTDLV